MPRKNSNTTATWNREDRDLLVELKTTLSAVQNDIKEIKDGTASKLRELETDKVSRADATRVQVSNDERFNALTERVNTNEKNTTSLQDSRIEYRTAIRTWGIVWGIVTFIGPILLTLYLRS